MRIHYDPQVDALYIELRDADIQESDEIAKGFIVDYDAEGNPVAIEILDASRVLGGREMRVELAVAEGRNSGAFIAGAGTRTSKSRRRSSPGR